MTCKASSFSAMVRWRSEIDPAWEVDTRHPGFATAEAAALAANGLGPDGLEKLQLESGRLSTLDVSGRRGLVKNDVAIWMMVPVAAGLPDNLRFERADETPAQLSAIGLDGLFVARRFRVLEDDSGIDVDVRVVVGCSRIVVLPPKTRTRRRLDADVPTA